MALEIEKIFALFKLFYNESDADEFLPVVKLAAEHTASRILCEDDFGCAEVHYLAAAEALCRTLEIKAVRERLALTRTGAVPQEQDWSARLGYARQLYTEYETICAKLLCDDTFVFVRVG
ncbi:MAG: hypothetical protein IJ305_09505 [Oscillospiraceae bacterium]|nr:hypothetical protein [Oscillospiraceae bacterium]